MYFGPNGVRNCKTNGSFGLVPLISGQDVLVAKKAYAEQRA
jgi:hypothetical protein